MGEVTAQSYYDQNYGTDDFNEGTYKTLLKSEQRAEDAKPKPRAKPQKKESEFSKYSYSELNSMALDQASKFMQNYPNSWKEKLKHDDKYKEIQKQLKYLKHGH